MINFKDIVIKELMVEAILLNEAVGDIASPACCVFSSASTGGTPPLSGYIDFSAHAGSNILHEKQNDYINKFGNYGGYPSDIDVKTLCNIINSGPVSRGGVAQYNNYAEYLPIIDLMFIVVQENGLNKTGDFQSPNKCDSTKFKPGTLYETWFKQLNTTATDSYPIDWQPLSVRGKDLKRNLSDGELRKYAAKLALEQYKVRSILFTLTNLLETRKEMRCATTIKKQKAESTLHPAVISLLTEPEKFSAGVQKLPAKVNNMYDSGNSGSLAQDIWDLGLIAKQFFDMELILYFGEDFDKSNIITTVKDVLLNNNVASGEAPSSEGTPPITGNFFYYKKSDRTLVAAPGIGDGGYILKNFATYKQNPHSAKIYEKISKLAEYVNQGLWSWKEVLGGAKGAVGAISSFGGKFGT